MPPQHAKRPDVQPSGSEMRKRFLVALHRAVMGYIFLKTGHYSFIADAVRAFVRKNPGLLGRRSRSGL
jgi:hypothetical protein